MTEKPILFSAPMVRAILEDRKTMTRRVIPKLPALNCLDIFGPDMLMKPGNADLVPYAVGDRLWVRETALFWIRSNDNKKDKVAAFAADGYKLEQGEKWTPSIFMPRWASRIALEVTGVKVERLQDISEEDAKAEGISQVDNGFHWIPDDPNEQYATLRYKTAKGAFEGLWQSINGAASWDANPWVVAIIFKRIT